MRILFLGTNLPIPPNNGHALRSLSIIQSLASSGHEIHFVSFAAQDRPKTLSPLPSYCRQVELVERKMVSLSLRPSYVRRAGCLLSLKPYSIERFRSEEMRTKIEVLLREKCFDLIVCDGLYSLVNVPRTEVPIALNCHNVEHMILKRYSLVEKNYLKKCYAVLEAQLLRRAERRSCRRATIAMACSDADRTTLLQLQPNLSIVVVPNAVDLDSYGLDESRGSGDNDPVLLFQGGMDWYPNRDAVEFFARSILDLVRAEYPTVRFVVAGRNPPARFVEELGAYRGVEFTGTVPDMRPFLSAATVVVVPLRMGSGTRIKILEAFAARKPVVSTRVGAEGLVIEAGKDILLADEPVEFARSVIALLRNPAKRNAMSKSARAVIVDRYSHQALKKSLDVLISSFA
jgi:glycosyltransferase involved in cell wall biosynthesis